MQVRHLIIAAMLVSAGAAQADNGSSRVHPGQLTGWSVTGKVVGHAGAGSTMLPTPAPISLEPTPAPVAAVPVVTAPDVAEVPEPSSIALLLAGAMGVGALRRRRAK